MIDNNHPQYQQDSIFMQQAIALAKQGQYRTKPNPNVGCVIVKHGQVIGTGFHPQAGQPHAEVFALREAGDDAEGATAYVTLEPCSHYGRTPPCANALVQAKVARVVVACRDPNPLVAGQGIALLQQAGIQVDVDICEDDVKMLNRGFLKAMASKMPYVRLKIASSLDGRTAMASGESKWITGESARQDVQHWRAISGAVITGINTVLADDCQLNVRQLYDNAHQAIDLNHIVQPKRVILDRQGRLPLSAKILAEPQQVIVVGRYRDELAELGVIQLADQPLSELLATLCREYQMYDVMVEAGATLSSAFLQQGLVDEMIHYVAPTLLGRDARPMFNAELQTMAEQYRFQLADVHRLGDDIRFHLFPDNYSMTKG